MLTFLCRDRDRPVPVLSNTVPLVSPLRSKGPKRPLIYARSKATLRRSLAFSGVLKRI